MPHPPFNPAPVQNPSVKIPHTIPHTARIPPHTKNLPGPPPDHLGLECLRMQKIRWQRRTRRWQTHTTLHPQGVDECPKDMSEERWHPGPIGLFILRVSA